MSIFYNKAIFLAFFIMLFLQGCATNQIDITKYSSNIEEKAVIPKACESEYTPKFSTIAVMDFTNNSTFGRAQVYTSTTTKKGSAIAGLIVSSQGAGLGAAAKSSKKTINIQREVDAKLSQTLTPLLESKISKLTGITLVVRNDLEKINEELKLQDSGLVDPSTALEFGRLSGARYIVTGSIDNVEITVRNNERAATAVNDSTSESKDAAIVLIGLFGKVLASVTDGILVKTTITVKILDVQTGKIIYATTLNDDVNIGKFSNPTYDVYIGGIKSAIISSLEQIDYKFSNHFSLKGHITKIKTDGSNRLIQVNLGRNHNLKTSQKFKTFSLEESVDPLLGTVTCDKIELPTTLEVTSLISDTHSWLNIEDGTTELKVLHLVESFNEK